MNTLVSRYVLLSRFADIHRGAVLPNNLISSVASLMAPQGHSAIGFAINTG